MTHSYIITGMTCNGCKIKVEEALRELQFIQEVKIDLGGGHAEIKMSEHIASSTLQEALNKKGDYQIERVIDPNNPDAFTHQNEKSTIQQLFPLFLIFAFITGASILIQWKKGWASNDFMMDFMGLFFVVFSFFKLLDLKGFPSSFKMYDPLAKLIPVYGWIYPFLELGLGLMFLMRWNSRFAIWATLILLGITTVGVTQALLDKKKVQCACLGTALKLPMTKATFIENTIMILMALFMLIVM